MQSKTVYEDFIDKYVDKAPMVEQALTTYGMEEYTQIVRFISVNTVA